MKTINNFALLLAMLAAGSSARAQQVVTLEAGVPITLTNGTSASGTGAVSYQWYRNGNPIAGATSATYNVPASEAKGFYVEFRRGATTPGCSGYNFSNAVVITFCNTLSTGNICWARTNVDNYQEFAALPDMLTKFYQWNRSTAWPASGSISGTWPTSITDASWTINPCPSGWRLPTSAELQDLMNSGSTWVAAGSARGNTVAGRFFGPNHNVAASCKLPSPMVDCIFLPAVGLRDDGGVLYYQSSSFGGYYWSTVQYSSTYVYGLAFDNSIIILSNTRTRAYGFSIRCVQ